MCYFELNVILYEMNCLSPSALHTKTVKKPHDFLERRGGINKMANNDEEQQSMGWVEAVLKRGVARC